MGRKPAARFPGTEGVASRLAPRVMGKGTVRCASPIDIFLQGHYNAGAFTVSRGNLCEGSLFCKILGEETMKNLYRLALALALVGLVDALYLTWMKVSGNLALCLGFGECDVVNSSPYAEVYGVPVALLGAVAYGIILALLLWEGRTQNDEVRRRLQYATFILTFAGTVYSGYLTYIEVAVLEAICPFCVLSAVVITLLWLISMVRLLREETTPLHQNTA